MRKLLITATFVLAAACGGSAGTAQSGGAGAAAATALAQRSYDVVGFDGVSTVGPHRVTVVVGPAFSVSAEGPQRTLDDTEVVVEDGRLKIQPVRDKRWNEYGRDYLPAHFTVTLPRLAAASMVGSGEMSVGRVAGEAFSASVAGSGTLDIAGLAVSQASLSIAGSGDLVAHGSARRADVSIAGSGNLHARGLSSDDASVSIAGSGDAELTVKDTAQISIVGSGDVAIAGSAHCTVSRVGSGDVTCANLDRETEFSLR